MANEENLSANIDVSVGIDSASIKKAKDDIASLGTAVDLIADKLGSIGKNQRPSSFKGISQTHLKELLKRVTDSLLTQGLEVLHFLPSVKEAMRQSRSV